MGDRFSTDAALRAQAKDRTIARDHIPSITDGQARALAWSARKRNGLLEARDVTEMLRDDSVVVARRGIEFAVDFAEIDLVVFLEGTDLDLAEVSAFTLGERASRGGNTNVELAALREMAEHHDDALCREAAIAALGAAAEHLDESDSNRIATRTVLLAALEDKATIRRRAIVGLCLFDDPESVARVSAARSDRDTQVRRIAKALTDGDLGDESTSDADR
jgi:hypothetical protein